MAYKSLVSVAFLKWVLVKSLLFSFSNSSSVNFSGIFSTWVELHVWFLCQLCYFIGME